MKNLLFLFLIIGQRYLALGQETTIPMTTQDPTIGILTTTGDNINWNTDDFNTGNHLPIALEKYEAVPSVKNLSFKVYPNPTRGQIHVDGLENRDHELWIMQLAALDGRLVYSMKLEPNEQNINLPDMVKGNYIIRFTCHHIVYANQITIF